MVRHGGRAVLDLLLPPQCLTCDAPVGEPGQLCGPCFGRTAFIAGPCCRSCGLPLDAGTVCDGCVEHPPAWGQGRAAMLYDDQARRILMPLKYGDRVETARALAPWMARAGATLLARADVLVPVPLHRWRMIGRRYNQAALLARHLSRRTGRPAVQDGLLRVRRTPPLGALSPARRQAALAGAFVPNPNRLDILRDARVLLIDDVLTTGATADACTRALLAAGAGGVDVLAAARVAEWRPR